MMTAKGTTSLAFVFFVVIGSRAQTPVDMVLVNGAVLTVDRNDTVAQAVRAACQASGTPLDDASLARIGTLLADLGARGIFVH